MEKKLISRFDGLNKEILNLKDVIIKNFQVKNQCLRKKVSDLESKVISLENDHNSLEQYGRTTLKSEELSTVFLTKILKQKVITISD